MTTPSHQVSDNIILRKTSGQIVIPIFTWMGSSTL